MPFRREYTPRNGKAHLNDKLYLAKTSQAHLLSLCKTLYKSIGYNEFLSEICSVAASIKKRLRDL